jgi:4-amino-4-deoxy-L-arabinose transferase-like glycosyltransferase
MRDKLNEKRIMSVNQGPEIELGKANSRNDRKVFLVLAWLLLFASYVALVLTKPITQDEGVFLTIGKYLNQGWLPYQDLVDHKPPGIYFLFACLFKLFGPGIWVAKVALIVTTGGASVMVGKIAELLKRGAGWYASGLFLFLMTQFEGYFLIAEPFLLFPLLLSLWLLLRFKNQPRWLFLAGILLAVAMLFKQTAVLSVLPILGLVYTSSLKQRFIFVMGIIFPLLLLLVYLNFNGIAAEAWQQVVVLTLTRYPNEPLGYVLQLLKTNFVWTLPIWMLLALGVKMSLSHKKLLWTLILLPLPFMFFRHYPHYWVQILPFVAIVVASVLVELRRTRLMLATLIFCLAIAAGKVAQDTPPNLSVLKEQLHVASILSQEPAQVVLAENQFTGFYFLLPQPPLNKFLYITEVTNAVDAEQRTIADLQGTESVMILWPVDVDYAYAKKLQAFVLQHSDDARVFSDLGMEGIVLRR